METREPYAKDCTKLGRRSFIGGTLTTTFAVTALGQNRDYGQSASPVRYPDRDIVVLDPRFAKYKIGNAAIQRLYTGMAWAEGPAWNGVGRYLVWSDIPNDVQHRFLAEDNHVSIFRNPANNSNGNTFDFEGRQLSCEHGTRRVVRYENNGNVTVLADKWQGKPFNAQTILSCIRWWNLVYRSWLRQHGRTTKVTRRTANQGSSCHWIQRPVRWNLLPTI